MLSRITTAILLCLPLPALAEHYGARLVGDTQTLTFAVTTSDPTANGAKADADSLPTYRVYEDETTTPILTGTMAKLDDANTVGLYSEQITLSSANGFGTGSSYTIEVAATVNSNDFSVSHNFYIVDGVNVTDGVVQANTVQHNGIAQTGGDVVALITTVDTVADGIKTKTDFLPSATAGQTNGLPILGANTAGWSFAGGWAIDNPSGDAFSLTSSGGNGDAIQLQAHGTGEAFKLTAGATGNVFELNSTSGHGILVNCQDGIPFWLASQTTDSAFVLSSLGPAVQISGDTGMEIVATGGAALRIGGAAGQPDIELDNSSSPDLLGMFGLATGNLDAQFGALPTASEIRTEIDSNSTQLAKLGTPVGASMSEDIANAGGGAALYSLVPSGTVVRVMRLDGSTAETPFCALYNATQVYGAANAYTIAATDLSDLADDIPDQLDAITDGNSNTLPIYQASGGHLSGLPTGAWNLHIYRENNLLGEADAVIPVYWDGTTLREATADVRVTAAAIEPGMTQSRVNDPPTYTLKVGNRNQGEFYCNKPVRLRPGAIDTDKAVGIDMAGIFGPHVQVETVGTPTVSDGSITCTELGPRDQPPQQLAMVQLGGIATAGETTTVDVEVTMENGDKALVTFEIEVSLR